MNTVQGDFFLPIGKDQDPYPENPNLTPEARERLMNQLIRLGDMMGDGMHHEPGGGWISKEYRSVMTALYPDIFKGQRQARNKAIDANMADLAAKNKCQCGGPLVQKRSGSWLLHCTTCSRQYRAGKSKKKRRE